MFNEKQIENIGIRELENLSSEKIQNKEFIDELLELNTEINEVLQNTKDIVEQKLSEISSSVTKLIEKHNWQDQFENKKDQYNQYLKEKKIENFYVLPAFKVIPPALDFIAGSSEINVHGFILPGHVSTIIGSKPYQFLSDEYHLPGCITGFEPIDILQGILVLVRQVDYLLCDC